MRPLLSVPIVLLLVPGWSGEKRLDLPRLPARLWVRPVSLDAQDPARRRVSRLTWLGGWQLSGSDPAFGGYSAIATDGRRFTLLGDGGNWLRFSFDGRRIGSAASGALPGGPGTGWDKRDRDSESLAIDPASGAAWVGFEYHNMIGRFTPGLAKITALRRVPEMRRWPRNGGAESLVRLPDGRFLALAEAKKGARGKGRQGLVFAGDPTRPGPSFAFTYLPPTGYEPSDATLLPDGRLIVLNRAFRLPYSFPVIVTEIPAGAVRPGAIVRPTEVARLEAPIISDNYEGVAATREGSDTILWIVSDDNQSRLQRTLLLKFRLDPPSTKARALK
ncbi:esterase-like activity of phytase family protein [Sphingomonas aracearum]|uniref:esterase-like activity of phytase family protein n=1 Tax=Sphingomonas aracearum TaxID=2283317 RepID=UPI001EF05893|nr:esterase-like activity of phytase family protein [Sphingomonas aracearum]